VITEGVVEIANVAPGVFTFNGRGAGVPAALTFRRKADGTDRYEPVARFDPAQSRYVTTPIDLVPQPAAFFGSPMAPG